VLEPEQGEADQGKPDIGVEDHARIPWRKVVRCDDLDYVTGCPAQREAGGTAAQTIGSPATFVGRH